MDLPRIAIISLTALSCSNATGSLLATLFHNWPHDNLLQISTTIPEDEVTSSYHQYFRPKSSSDIFPPLGGVLRQTRLIDMFCLNWKSLQKTVEKFQPDILYTRVVGYPLFFTNLSYKLSRNLQLPLVCHIMDDYERLFSTSPKQFERYLIKAIFTHNFRKLLNQSCFNFAISPKMAKTFSDRYNAPFNPLHNGIDPFLWPQKGMKETSLTARKNVFRLVLAGALAPEKEGAVAIPLSQAIAELNGKEEIKYELILNTQEHYLPFARKLAEKYAGVKAQGYLSLQNYRRLLQNANLLVLTRNFDERSKAYTEYSFQNKLPEYMASGTPILCIGPAWENSVQFLKYHSAGKTVTDYTPHAIKNAVKGLQKDFKARNAFAKKAKLVAFSKFNINSIRKKFENTMCELMGKS